MGGYATKDKAKAAGMEEAQPAMVAATGMEAVAEPTEGRVHPRAALKARGGKHIMFDVIDVFQ